MRRFPRWAETLVSDQILNGSREEVKRGIEIQPVRACGKEYQKWAYLTGPFDTVLAVSG
jgi:hypothetical protein